MIRRARARRRRCAALPLLLLAAPALANETQPEPYLADRASDAGVEVQVDSEAAAAPELEAEAEVAREIAARDRDAQAAPSRPGVFSQAFDLVILRPFGLAATCLGGAFFVPAALLSAPSGAYGVDNAWDVFVGSQLRYTFTRSLGSF